MHATSIFDSVHRTRSTADLAMLCEISPDGFTIRGAAAEAARRSPETAKVLQALAARLVRTMSDLAAAEARPATPAEPMAKPKRTPAKRKAAAAADTAAGVPLKLGADHLPMPDRWEDLSETQAAWFAQHMPFLWANRLTHGTNAGNRGPAESYDRHQKAKPVRSWADRWAAEVRKIEKRDAAIAEEQAKRGYAPVPDMRTMSVAELRAMANRGTMADPESAPRIAARAAELEPFPDVDSAYEDQCAATCGL